MPIYGVGGGSNSASLPINPLVKPFIRLPSKSSSLAKLTRLFRRFDERARILPPPDRIATRPLATRPAAGDERLEPPPWPELLAVLVCDMSVISSGKSSSPDESARLRKWLSLRPSHTWLRLRAARSGRAERVWDGAVVLAGVVAPLSMSSP